MYMGVGGMIISQSGEGGGVVILVILGVKVGFEEPIMGFDGKGLFFGGGVFDIVDDDVLKAVEVGGGVYDLVVGVHQLVGFLHRG